jgi:DNA replication protein DnaC
MREELLKELETEYEQIRTENERTESDRKEKIRREEPGIYELVREREELVYGTLRAILNGKAETEKLPEKMEKLSAGIREKLTAAGYPADYLAPVYRCPICQDQGRVGELIKEPCECLKKAYQRKLREKIGLNSEKRESFETFNLALFPDETLPGRSYSQRQRMDIARDDCKEWADRYPEVRNRDLLLTGKSGLGKTFLLRAIAERLIERDVNVLIISAYKMLEIVRKAYFSNDETAEEIAGAEVLMIDDLGSEPLMQNVTVEQLFNLLNERQNRQLSTVISTNLTMQELRDRYTERIASRLRDRNHWKVITLEGKDIRS